MGEIILANVVERKSGYLYYVDGEGNVCEAKLVRGRKKKIKNEVIVVDETKSDAIEQFKKRMKKILNSEKEVEYD